MNIVSCLCCPSATLVDDVSSGAILSVSPHGGVSVSMSLTYLSPTPGNQDCQIDARVIKSGRTLAFAEVEIRHKITGTVTGSGNGSVQTPAGTPDQANSAEAATAFVDDMCSETLEGFDPEATHSFDTTALYGLKDITATAGQVVCTLPVSQRTQNRYNTLHGGCTGRVYQSKLMLLLFLLLLLLQLPRVIQGLQLPHVRSAVQPQITITALCVQQ